MQTTRDLTDNERQVLADALYGYIADVDGLIRQGADDSHGLADRRAEARGLLAVLEDRQHGGHLSLTVSSTARPTTLRGTPLDEFSADTRMGKRRI